MLCFSFFCASWLCCVFGFNLLRFVAGFQTQVADKIREFSSLSKVAKVKNVPGVGGGLRGERVQWDQNGEQKAGRENDWNASSASRLYCMCYRADGEVGKSGDGEERYLGFAAKQLERGLLQKWKENLE